MLEVLQAIRLSVDAHLSYSTGFGHSEIYGVLPIHYGLMNMRIQCTGDQYKLYENSGSPDQSVNGLL